LPIDGLPIADWIAELSLSIYCRLLICRFVSIQSSLDNSSIAIHQSSIRRSALGNRHSPVR